MPDKMIKKLSRQLNHGTYLRSASIPVVCFIFIMFFSFLPWLITFSFRTTGLYSTMQTINPTFPAIFLAVLCCIIILLSELIYSSFSMGENAWYSGRLTRKKLCGKRLRFWFTPSHSFKALKLKTILFLLKFIWTLAFITPALMIFSVIIGTALTGGIEFYLLLSLTIGGISLLIIGLIFRFIIIQRYYLAPYLIADNPKLSPVQAIKQSKNLLDGHLMRIIKFKLKFFPCFMLYLFVFPAIYFHPYYKQSCSVLAKEICL